MKKVFFVAAVAIAALSLLVNVPKQKLVLSRKSKLTASTKLAVTSRISWNQLLRVRVQAGRVGPARSNLVENRSLFLG